MRSLRFLEIYIILSCVTASPVLAQQTWAEKLGWDSDDRIVMFHVDDIGMSHASNMGGIEAVENGIATTWSVMMPCSWVPEIAIYLEKHPTIDSGLHLTLNAEYKLYKWGPVAGKPAVPGLVDPQGYLWDSHPPLIDHATADEVEREIRAQIERAEALGMPITHLDSHMGTLFRTPEFMERYVRVGIEKNIPMLVPPSPDNQRIMQRIWDAGLPVIDHIQGGVTPLDNAVKSREIIKRLRALKPGITEFIFHASRPDENFPLMMQVDTGVLKADSPARLGDLEMALDPAVRKAIEDAGIKLTTWRELKERRQRAGQ
jgi:chitin disaccharide deacetylase